MTIFLLLPGSLLVFALLFGCKYPAVRLAGGTLFFKENRGYKETGGLVPPLSHCHPKGTGWDLIKLVPPEL